MKRLVAAAAVLAVASGMTAPADAGPKKKPKPIKGSYTVDLPPDPTINVFTTAGQGGSCAGAIPPARHRKSFKVPAAGVLKVVLDAADPAPGTPFVFDWDMFVLAADDEVLGEGTSSEAHEEVSVKLKKKQDVVFLVCNLNGQPKATVNYVFTYA